MIGQTLSHYRILDRIGAGAMGEVYLAEDTKLRRKVALKVLPPRFASDPGRLERFEREARAAAALNHPGIVTLLTVEEFEGVHFLTMELVDGESLDRLIPPGGMPLERLFEIAIPLAEALWAAHKEGVVHRDLKPANVMIAAGGQVKILDFGLAKQQAEDEPQDATSLRTEALLTQAGQVVGTAAYMSPEQVEARPADHRSDIFSLGVMLHEMAVGKRPFEGRSQVAVMSAILADPPAGVCALKPELPKALERIVHHCLEKDPDRRFQTALDVRNELERLADELGGARRTPVPPPAKDAWRSRAYLAAGLLALTLVAVGIAAYLSRSHRWETLESRPPPRPTLHQVTFSEAVEEFPAFSADGKRLAFTREVDGYRKLFMLDLESGDERQLTDGEVDDFRPAWSPDGEVLLFVRSNRTDGKMSIADPFSTYDEGDIWRLELAGGRLMKIADEAFNPVFAPGGDRIAFDAAWVGPHRIWVADPLGRNPRQVTTDDSEFVSHLLPHWSPDGSRIVFQNNHWTTRFNIKAVDVATGEMRWVVESAYLDVEPAWSADGAHIYFSSYRSGGLNLWRVPVGDDGTPTGPPGQVTSGAGNDLQATTAPGGEVAFAISSLNADIWRLPLDPATGKPTGGPEPLVATTREDSRGVTSPDGALVAFNSDRGGQMNLWLLSLADGSTRQVTEGLGGDFQANWSPDGRRLAFFSSRSGNGDVWTVDLESGELRQLTDDPAIDINPFYSPDGEWIAFQSDRGGRREAWIMRADGSDERQLTSNSFGGVHYFCWTADSGHVIFRGAEGGAWRVPVGGGEPELVSENGGGWHMSLSPDRTLILDNDHQAIFLTPARPGGERRKVFEFDDPTISIDYTVWSPDGRWVLFDRKRPQGGDIWVAELGSGE